MPLDLKDIEKAFGKFRYSELGGGAGERRTECLSAACLRATRKQVLAQAGTLS